MSTAPSARPEIGSSQIVEASAGTRKTRALVEQVGPEHAERGETELNAVKDLRRLS